MKFFIGFGCRVSLKREGGIATINDASNFNPQRSKATDVACANSVSFREILTSSLMRSINRPESTIIWQITQSSICAMDVSQHLVFEP